MTGCPAGNRMHRCDAVKKGYRRGADGRLARLVMAAQTGFCVHDAVCALSRRNPRQGCWVHYSYFRLLIVHCNFRIQNLALTVAPAAHRLGSLATATGLNLCPLCASESGARHAARGGAVRKDAP